MKKIKYLSILAVAAFFVSCEDAIDIEQPGLLTADAAINTVNDLNDILFAAYNTLDTSPEIHFNSVFTDEIRIAYSTGGQGLQLYRRVFNPASAGPTILWVRNYRGINQATRIIEGYKVLLAVNDDTDPDNDLTAAEIATGVDVVGQAHAVRAFLHLQMLSYYSADLADNNSLGIPAIDFVPGTDFTPLRNTTGEVYDLIYDDLDDAISQIAAEGSNGTTFFTKDAARAMKARAASYRKDFATASPLAQALLTKYPLANPEEYDAMVADTGNTEVIMKLERTINDSYDGQGSTGSSAAGGWAGASFAFQGPGLAGGPYYEMATDLWFAYKTGDLRRDNNGIRFPEVGAAGDRDVYIVNRYRGSEGQPLMNDHKIFRSSEMLMILAEGAADANNRDQVADFLDQLIDARFGDDQDTPVYANITEAYGAILDQRRVEFAFEGFRYKDLRRLGTLGNRTAVRANMDCAPFGACDIAVTDFRFTWPIPLAEFRGNPGLREQQNSGY
jgi:hypothetical protein